MDHTHQNPQKNKNEKKKNTRKLKKKDKGRINQKYDPKGSAVSLTVFSLWFIDELFMTWTGTQEELLKFINKLNQKR